VSGGRSGKGERLDERVLREGLAESRSVAQSLILAGRVLVDDEPVDKAGARIAPDRQVRLKGGARPFVSRGGEKLAAALGDGRLDPLVEDRLFRLVMTRTLVADPAFERLLTGLRRLCLHAVAAKAKSRSGRLHDDPGFATALARQCFITNYAYAETEDLIDETWVPREFDQTNTLNVDFDFLVTRKWRLNLAWRYHTGWPTTPISLVEVEGGNGSAEEDEELETEYEIVLGPFNSDRLPDYHRFDARLSRQWGLSFGELTFFVDIQNVLDRKNVAGFDITVDTEEGELEQIVEEGVGFLPSIGISIEF